MIHMHNKKVKKKLVDEWDSGVKVHHRKHTPVHIIGHGRSGTSILGALCRYYLGLGIGTESQFIPRYYRLISKYGDLKIESNLRQLIKDISTERYFERSRKFNNYVFDPEKAFQSVKERTYPGVLNAVFMQLADHLGMERWAEKTPDHTENLPMLEELFPDSQYIIIVRDGRDVALSEFLRPFGENNAYSAAVKWKKEMKSVISFYQSLTEDRYILIRYEDIMTDPVMEMNRLIEFLDIADDDDKLKNFVAEDIVDNLMLGNFNKWKTQMSPKDIRVFNSVTGDILSKYNYDVANETHALGMVHRLFWRFDNRVKKLANKEYRKDLIYKFQLLKKDANRFLKCGK